MDPKKNKKIVDIVKEYCANPNAIGRPKGTTDAATRELSESIKRKQQAKQCMSCMK
jgi:hypothetical protein